MSKTPLREGFVTGSGAVLDVTTLVTVSDTRIRAIQATGVGTFLITGVSVDPAGNTKGSNIKFGGIARNLGLSGGCTRIEVD